MAIAQVSASVAEPALRCLECYAPLPADTQLFCRPGCALGWTSRRSVAR